MSIQGWIATLLNKRELAVPETWPADWAEQLVKKHNAEPWFAYIVKERVNRWDVWESGFWVAQHLSSSAHILETGCGIASNLIWLGQQGFKNLDGTDIEPNAIAAGAELAESLKVKVNLRVEDGLNPTFPYDYNYDVVFALNWTHLLSAFDLTEFLKKYAVKLNKGGYIINDVINATYSQMENNQYLTSDLNKPEAQRQPSEYKKRYSDAEVETAAQTAGFKLVHKIIHEQKIPKSVFIFQKL